MFMFKFYFISVHMYICFIFVSICELVFLFIVTSMFLPVVIVQSFLFYVCLWRIYQYLDVFIYV